LTPSATQQISTLSLHDALPILGGESIDLETRAEMEEEALRLSTDLRDDVILAQLIGQHANTLLALQRWEDAVAHLEDGLEVAREDRKSTRLNSSHVKISYAVFC